MNWLVGFKMNDWLEITRKLSKFGSNMKFFGGNILALATIVSSMFFWYIIFSYYTPYQEIAVLMLQIIKYGIQLLIAGFIIHYLFFFINELIHKRRMKKVKIKIKGEK